MASRASLLTVLLLNTDNEAKNVWTQLDTVKFGMRTNGCMPLDMLPLDNVMVVGQELGKPEPLP